MNKVNKSILAITMALTVGSVFAQSSGPGSGSSGAGQGGSSASTGSFQDWVNTFGAKNNGRISRKAYMAESGRRWDSMDKTKKGLTMEEINNTYYSSGPAAVMGGPTSNNKQDKKGITQ